MSADWTQSFFSGLIAESQRRLPQQTLAEADFLQEALAIQPGQQILDVPCGTGRLANELAARGCSVTGVDISEELLRDAHQEAARRTLSTTFQRRDMRELPWSGHFDASFCFGNSFSYFDHDQNLRFIRGVSGVLKPGGRFALETRFIAESVFMQLASKRWYPFGDLYFLHDTNYDPSTATLTSTYTMIRDGQVEVKQATYRIYTLREVCLLFAEAGFVGIECFGSLSREPFRLGSPGLWLIARRPA